ncbi:MAG: hypothetical protein LUF04_13685 [Bacteroides sp.]|nr:hypothetical protein [Bacteroides sp.]
MTNNPIWQIIILVTTSFCSWIFGKLQTRREKAKSDLEIIREAIAPQLESIKVLTEHNNRMVQMYLEEQKERIQTEGENKMLKAEKDDLAEKVSKLTQKVDKLEKIIQKLTHEKKPPSA